MDIGASKTDQLRCSQARLGGETEERVVSPPGPGRPIRGGKQCADFRLGQEGHESSVEALGRDGENALDGAPRTDPDEWNCRIRLLPRVIDGESHARPGMKDLRFWEKRVGDLRHPLPDHPRPLATPAQLPMPEDNDVVAKRGQRQAVGRHGVIGEIAADDLCQPFSRLGDWPMPAPSQRLLRSGTTPPLRGPLAISLPKRR